MRYVPIAQVCEGMVLGRAVFDAAGAALLTAGTTLTSTFILRLSELGYPALYIRSPFESETDDLVEPVRQETRLKAQATLYNLAANLQTKRSLPRRFDEVRNLVHELVDELSANDGALLSTLEIRSVDSYTFGHSVNTCVLSLMVGISLGLSRGRLLDLGVGTLLHDLGKIFVPREILNKPGRLSSEEFGLVKTHSARGYHLLRDQVNTLSAHVAYQHHERCDGQGYPRGLGREEIILFARVAAVVDVFDALTSDRVYAGALWPEQALGMLFQEAPDKFDLECVKALGRNVAAYPVGTVVVLDNGATGEVVKATRETTYVLVTGGLHRGQVVECPSDNGIVSCRRWPTPRPSPERPQHVIKESR